MNSGGIPILQDTGVNFGDATQAQSSSSNVRKENVIENRDELVQGRVTKFFSLFSVNFFCSGKKSVHIEIVLSFDPISLLSI